MAALEVGLKYFTAVNENEVLGPVNGEKFLSGKAKHTYEYQGKAYFFRVIKVMRHLSRNQTNMQEYESHVAPAHNPILAS